MFTESVRLASDKISKTIAVAWFAHLIIVSSALYPLLPRKMERQQSLGAAVKRELSFMNTVLVIFG